MSAWDRRVNADQTLADRAVEEMARIADALEMLVATYAAVKDQELSEDDAKAAREKLFEALLR